MQFKVPQNVQMEDRILPFMTLRQLVICMLGGGFTYMVYLLLEHQAPAIWIPPVALLGLLTLAIGFLKIRDIPFISFMLLLLERYLNETKRVWIKSTGDVFPWSGIVAKKPDRKPSTQKKRKQASAEEVQKITKMLDQD